MINTLYLYFYVEIFIVENVYFINGVSDVPTPPRNLDVYDVFKTSCKLKWEVPEDHGGSPILHYIIERQDLALKGIQYNILKLYTL